MTETYSGLATGAGFLFPDDIADLPAGVPKQIRVYETETTGPPVIVLHELNGLTDFNMHFGSRLAQQDFKVYMPALFGRRGKKSWIGCIGSLFVCMRTGRTSPVSDWVRALAGRVSAGHGGAVVGVIGMCMTGGVVFPTALDPNVGAVVAAEPSLPWPRLPAIPTARRNADLGMSEADRRDIERARDGDGHLAKLLGLRYRDDKICPAGRLDAAVALFGASAEKMELGSHKRWVPLAVAQDHSVLCREWERYQKAGAPEQARRESEAAFARVVEFLRTNLGP